MAQVKEHSRRSLQNTCCTEKEICVWVSWINLHLSLCGIPERRGTNKEDLYIDRDQGILEYISKESIISKTNKSYIHSYTYTDTCISLIYTTVFIWIVGSKVCSFHEHFPLFKGLLLNNLVEHYLNLKSIRSGPTKDITSIEKGTGGLYRLSRTTRCENGCLRQKFGELETV